MLLDSVGVACEVDVFNIQCNVVSLNTQNAFLREIRLLSNTMYAMMEVFKLFNRLAALDSARSHVSIENFFALLDSVGVA